MVGLGGRIDWVAMMMVAWDMELMEGMKKLNGSISSSKELVKCWNRSPWLTDTSVRSLWTYARRRLGKLLLEDTSRSDHRGQMWLLGWCCRHRPGSVTLIS